MVVSGMKIDVGGTTQTISAATRRAIQSIKEVVGNHSESDIYIILKESNMDPDETAQKLLNQDPFREVKRRKDKKKENAACNGPLEPRKLVDPNTAFKDSSEPRKVTEQNTVFKRSFEPRKLTEHTQGMRSQLFSDRNVRRTGYVRTSFPDAGISRQFRVVRDNRVNRNANREVNPSSVQSSTSASMQVTPNVPGKSLLRTPTDQRHISHRNSEGPRSFQAANGPSDLGRGHFKDTNSSNTNRKGVLEESRVTVPSLSLSQGPKPHTSQPSPTVLSSNTVVGLYSSSSDPVHVPSNSRSSGNVGAIRREVGVVGIRRQSSVNSAKQSTVPSSSVSTLPTNDISSIPEPHLPSGVAPKSAQFVQTSVSESVVQSTSLNKSSSNNQYGGKPHQQPPGHHKAQQSNMEWKPKSSQKTNFISPVIKTASTAVPLPSDGPTDSKEANHLQEKLSLASLSENEHVFIPQHLRVPEADRTRLTFGSFGMECNSAEGFSSGFEGLQNQQSGLQNQQSFNSASFGAPSASGDDVNQMNLVNGDVRSSGSASPASTTASEHLSSDKKEMSSSGNLESSADIGLVRNNSPSYAPAEPQQQPPPSQQQDPPLPSFVGYDPQTGYEMPYYRPSTGESTRSHGLPSPGEGFGSHIANNIPASSVAMLQQQAVPQMYPQVVSHFPNFMPYRQYISPVYVPPMGVPGYSGNPAYPHPSNGNSYLLMPGGSSHLAAGGLKYGAPQYKPISAGAPTGFGSYSNPTGYALNTQGAVGGANSLDEATRMKFKDGNVYVPNPQAETSEIWIQPQREHPGMQTAPYYNIQGQPPHAAYLPSHPGHATFNGATTVQPAHMQFPGLYHPSQQAAIANTHHMVPNIGSNVGVGVGAPKPGAQIGTYQQPQIGHMNWNTNF